MPTSGRMHSPQRPNARRQNIRSNIANSSPLTGEPTASVIPDEQPKSFADTGQKTKRRRRPETSSTPPFDTGNYSGNRARRAEAHDPKAIIQITLVRWKSDGFASVTT